MQTATNIPAILRGEQRSARYKYRHSVSAAASELGIPVTWIWSWLLAKRLNHQIWLKKVWVRLEHAEALFEDTEAFREAFYATGDHLTSPESIRRVAQSWPDESHPYIKFQPPARLFLKPADIEVSSSNVIREEEAA